MMEMFVTRRVTVLAAVLVLAGCGSHKASSGDGGPFAGLDGEILKWRGEIVKSGRLCQGQAADQKCSGFEVACKAERTVTSAEQAAGVTAKVVAAMNWTGWDPKLKQAQAGSEAALFTKGPSGWTRTVNKPVNMSTCGDL